MTPPQRLMPPLSRVSRPCVCLHRKWYMTFKLSSGCAVTHLLGGEEGAHRKVGRK